MPGEPSSEEMRISDETMKTPEQKERERIAAVVRELAVLGYGNLVSDPERLKAGADYVTEGVMRQVEEGELEIPIDYVEGVKKLLSEIRQREGISVTPGQYLIEEVVPRIKSGDAPSLYTTISDLGRPLKERGRKVELDPEKDAAILEAAEMIFRARNSSEETDKKALEFYNAFNRFVEQRIRIVAEQEKLLIQYQELLSGGYAEEIIEGTGGVLPAESLLEASGDERMWPDLSDEEKRQIRELLQKFADDNGMDLVEDEKSCMVVVKKY